MLPVANLHLTPQSDQKDCKLQWICRSFESFEQYWRDYRTPENRQAGHQRCVDLEKSLPASRTIGGQSVAATALPHLVALGKPFLFIYSFLNHMNIPYRCFCCAASQLLERIAIVDRLEGKVTSHRAVTLYDGGHLLGKSYQRHHPT